MDFAFKERFRVPSQSYSMNLIRAALQRKAKLVVMRSGRLLEKEIPDLKDVDYITSVGRLAILSERNVKSVRSGRRDVFEEIVGAIETAP